jgi:hypothetical protein
MNEIFTPFVVFYPFSCVPSRNLSSQFHPKRLDRKQILNFPIALLAAFWFPALCKVAITTKPSKSRQKRDRHQQAMTLIVIPGQKEVEDEI